ncbi:MAG TPA: YggS family pyridoxal phosphate-dependent enzyme [Thermoanaerobaculia bacterium]|nr:YggS family pyridoxal phosphate-dependent enzyme [Thermoanaerobaculia bacterium]
MQRPEEIRANLTAVERRIEAACQRAGRRREEITLVAVSKTFPAGDVEAAVAAGASDVGENRVQEARDKKPAVAAGARWHLIGHLQSNKAKDAVRLFEVIHTIDSESLAERVGRAAAAAGKVQEVLIEVNIGREPQKAGIDPADADAMTRSLRAIEALSLTGLMTIPPQGDAEEMRPYFRELRKMKDDLGLAHLSMGMTDDFEVAIEEGATIIRVGRAIFGTRG